MKDGIGIAEVVFAVIAFAIFCIAGLSIINLMRNSKPSDSSVQEPTSATDELTTYQTIVINGTEYELVPKN